MTLGVVGGRLQGLEAAYLAGRAGWRTRVVDRSDPETLPAAGLCDEALRADATDPRQLDRALSGVDLVLPALEDEAALEGLCRWARAGGVPLAFDLPAWRLTASKRASHELFDRLGVPTPRPWPHCAFPVLGKPERGSGSEGVCVFRDGEELEAARKRGLVGPGTLLQEFLPGPSFSLEILGVPGAYRTLQVTDLAMDPAFDCKRVQAPTALSPGHVRELERLSLALAGGVGLRGLMDVEAVLHEDTLRVLEIDARLPSQTPTAVYWSTGINMLEELAALFLPGVAGRPAAAPRAAPAPRSGAPTAPRAVIFEHLRAEGGVLETGGEHLLAGASGIRLQPGLFGTEEALSNYAPGRDAWVATLVLTAPDREQAEARRQAVVSEIMARTGAARFHDPEPEAFR